MRWLGYLGLATSLVAAKAPPLSISLETSWSAPPLILEILETVYDESPAAYFPFLRLLTAHIPSSDATNPRETLETALDLLSTHDLLSKPSSLSTLNYALGLHTAAPRIEAFYNWYEGSIDESAVGVEGCGSWVEWRGKGFCQVEGLRADVELSLEEAQHHIDSSQPPTLLPFDHTSRPGSSSPSTTVLYFDPSSSSSAELLNYLVSHSAVDTTFSYLVRYKPNREAESRHTHMSGYGVELALKRTDYLVVDDRATGQAGKDALDGKTDETSAIGVFSEKLGPDPWSELATPLTTEEINELGLKASTLIMDSPDKLDALVQLTQDFPKYSAALARKVNVSDAVSGTVVDMFRRAAPTTGIYINGKLFTEAELNAYSLLKAVRSERDLALSLIDLGLTSQQAYQLISDPVIGRQETEDDPGDGIVDASDRAEGENVIIWWNNIEKDSRYKRWSSDVSGFLRPLYPGQLHTVRRNTFNAVFVLDLALTTSLEIVTEQMIAMIKGNIPLRFGVVPMFDAEINDSSLAMAKLIPYCIKTFGRGYTQEMLTKIIQRTPRTAASPGIVTLETLRFAYEVIAEESGKDHISFDELVGPEYDMESIEAIRRYTTRLAATKQESEQGHIFLNGKYFPASAQWMGFVQGELMSQLNFVQQQLVAGAVDENRISTLFYDLPTTSLRRNKLIIPNLIDNKLKITPLDKVFKSAETKMLTEQMMYHVGDASDTTISMWIIGDLDSPETRQLVDDALANLETGRTTTRLGFVHVPETGSRPSSGFSYFVYTALKAGKLSQLSPEGFTTLAKSHDEQCGGEEDSMACLSYGEQRDADGNPIGEDSDQAQDLISTEEASEFWKAGTNVAETLGIKSRHPHILVNGRLIGPVTRGSFAKDDFVALEAYEQRKRVKPVYDLLQTMLDSSSFERSTLASLISSASSIIASAYAASDDGIFTPMPLARSRDYETLDRALSFSIGDPDNAILHVAAVLDPVSEAAQRASFLLQTLSRMEGITISVHLAPVPLMTELSLKRFYRFALSPKLEFDVDGNDIAPQITFNDLPNKPLFTLAMDTPPAWIVSPRHSPFDLDNLVLGSTRDPVHVSFNLKQLLIEGHAREANNAPPRGLQLQLTTQGLEIASDTQVMANLGYLQFKATPGIYHLAIRPGRGTEVYDLESVGNDGWDSAGVNVTGTTVALSSFDGMTILPRFTRKAGMELVNVLVEDVPVSQSYPQAVFSRMKQMIGLGAATTTDSVKHSDINIFTVASGLLYERFASIMILSVMKNTQSSVKFWFIENFLSPEFLEFLPKMADEYGFQYQFITYKWPHWLRTQTEKQRIIWAYKILFLDVLFPMDLDKVIFVDADQIVRVDMKELVDVDLHGHVYGYPPMGNSREEMEGFRFWKTGYWREALRGRPYHISALYVVDLKRFRQLATGDRLRGQYHALSADPNSLANLDQDLPNSMQDQIPIFTLEQDWLWCQTWCDDESLATAKTIDLCQNPLTKEPKLVRARQIPEWDTYDQEIAAFAARISEGEIGLAASVDDLAGGPVSAPAAQEPSVGVEDQESEDEVEREEQHRRRIDDEL